MFQVSVVGSVGMGLVWLFGGGSTEVGDGGHECCGEGNSSGEMVFHCVGTCWRRRREALGLVSTGMGCWIHVYFAWCCQDSGVDVVMYALLLLEGSWEHVLFDIKQGKQSGKTS